MRLHELNVTAFGPFAGTERVDFDALNDAGLFLLAGPTGAGKTSILDAVCFALYGVVPGVRGVKTLKSQHADDAVKPEVILEFSVRERRFQLRRSPEWTRPKRRGTGTRTEPAAASLLEFTGGDEQLLTSRAAEVGLLVGELIGMKAGQFQQVAMLPQGDFQRFLHASTQDRHDVLQQLFQTDRFAKIEEWVQDHSRNLRQRSEQGQSQVQQLLHTLAERAEVEQDGDEGLAGGLPDVLECDTALEWARATLSNAEADLSKLRVAHQAAAGALTTGRERLEDLRRVADAVARRDEAKKQLGILQSTDEASARAREVLDADARATGCLPVIELCTRAAVDHAAALRRRDDALTDLRDFDSLESVEGAVGAHLREAERAVRTRIAHAEALLPRVRALETVASELATTERDLGVSETALAEAVASRDVLPDSIATARMELDVAAAAAARREAISLKVTEAKTRAEAAAAVPAAVADLQALQDVVRNRRDAAADARDVVQALQARRLAGIAAELAGTLQPGEACTVCGSCDHPQPAAPQPDSVTPEEQEEALAVHEAAQDALVEATREATSAERFLETLRSKAAGRSATDATDDVVRLEIDLADAEQAEIQREALTRTLAELQGALEKAAAEVGVQETRVAGLSQLRRSQQDAIEENRTQIVAALGDVEPESIPELLRTLQVQASSLAAASMACDTEADLAERLAALETQAETTFKQQGFTTTAEVRGAALTAEERVELESLLEQRAAAAAAARATLASAEVQAVGDQDPPELGDAAAETATLEASAEAASRAFHLQEQRVTALRSLLDRLVEAVADWSPLRNEHERAESMAKLVRGMGTDNHLQMRLSSYVLATRLDQVLDAANERLSHMRDQRYLLQRTGRAARKGSQAGLGLEVIDQWTGDVRDPATLSGGETFVVSLSLALGLADVVTQEAGGTEIETLFVDEGFGTLDPDTLDDVMDRLDGLRAGGRTVGVVSHVSELRTRIPTQLHVRKTPSGSTIHAETLVG